MEWVVFVAVVIFIVHRFFWSKNRQRGKSNQNLGDQPAGKKDEDDFAGSSVGAFFLLEEIIDPGVGRHKSVNQGFSQTEQREDEFFEEEFFE
jgi:uncharacterized membrane protein